MIAFPVQPVALLFCLSALLVFISFFSVSSPCRVYVVLFLALCMYTKKPQKHATRKHILPEHHTGDVLHIFGQVVWDHRLMPLGGGIAPRPRLALARIIVARPRAVPIPLPLIALTPVRLNIGAFCNISGTMKNRTMLPLI